VTAPISRADWERQRRAATEAMPDVVAQVGLPKVLLPYQAEAVRLLDTVSTRVLFIEKSRRVGLTWGLAAYAVLRAARDKAAGGMDVMYISYSQEMTREFIDACAMWARAFNSAAMEAEELLFADADKDGDKSIQAFRIRFASGFEIMALQAGRRDHRRSGVRRFAGRAAQGRARLPDVGRAGRCLFDP
jgi:phage FluMu gp28-like protein